MGLRWRKYWRLEKSA